MYKYLKIWEELDFDKSKPIMFDTETIGLGGKTRLVQLSQGDNVYILDCFYMSVETIKHYLYDTHLVLQNAGYDFSCVDFQGWLPKKFDDTLYMARLYYPYLDAFNLGALLANIGIKIPKDQGNSDWSKVLDLQQLEYAANDVIQLQKLYDAMQDILDQFVYKLDMLNLRYALQYQLVGCPIRQRALVSERNKIRKQLKQLESELPADLNVNSPKQVCNFVGTTSSSSDILKELNTKESKLVLDARSCYKKLSFIETFDNTVNRVYGFFNPSGAISGRWKCKSMPAANINSMNLQQFPNSLKHLVGFDDERRLVYSDFSGLEIHTIALVMKEEKMLKLLAEGADLHTATAQLIYNKKEITKLERGIAKGITFSAAYGGGAPMMCEFIKSMTGISISVQETAVLRQKWLDAYPNIKKFHNMMGELIRNKSYIIVESLNGRRMKATSYNQAINLPCQSTGAEVTKLAIHYLYKALPEVRMCNTIHDSFLLECENEEEANIQGKILVECMAKAFLEIAKVVGVDYIHMKNEYEVLSNWGGEH